MYPFLENRDTNIMLHSLYGQDAMLCIQQENVNVTKLPYVRTFKNSCNVIGFLTALFNPS